MEFPSWVLLLGICYLHWTTAAPSKSANKAWVTQLQLCATDGAVESLSELKNDEEIDVGCMEVSRSDRMNRIDLSGYELKTFNKNWYRLNTSEVIIDLSNNLITEITPELLNDIPSSMIISLNGNNITAIKKNIIKNNHSMELDLSRNPLRAIEDDAFKNSRLTKLEIFHTPLNNLEFIRTLPDTIEILSVSFNKMLTELPIGVFRNLPKLWFVNLAFNKIQRIRENTFSGFGHAQTGFTSLSLRNNQINSIETRSFSDMYVHEIDLSSNNITNESFGRDAFNNSVIQEINYYGNPIDLGTDEVYGGAVGDPHLIFLTVMEKIRDLGSSA